MKSLLLSSLIMLVAAQAIAQGRAGITPQQRTLERKARIVREIKSAFAKQDDLTLRVLIKAMAPMKMTFEEWSFVRRALQKRPTIGFDLMFKWDSIRPKEANPKSREAQVATLIANADTAMMEEDFDKAFRYYQLIAKFLKKEIMRGKRENYYLFWHATHSMARALYGSGRYKEALQVYSWIGRDYFRYRQTLFERMWAAFRANRLDMAMGAIASQQSSYFSDYLEPETYLVQVYILKKLCREEELKQVRNLIRSVRAKYDPKKSVMTLEDWAKSDVELISLFNLTKVVLAKEDPYVSRKTLEQSRIKEMLTKKFESERARLSKQMDMVLAFSNLSVAMDNTRVNSDVVPDRGALLKSSREFWPADKAEDWVDELGSHLYIGESQCEKAQPR